MVLIKKYFFLLTICICSGVLTALSFNNHILRLSYRSSDSRLLFVLVILLFSGLVYLCVYKFAWFKRLNMHSIRDKWLWLCFSIAVGALFIPLLSFKIPVNLTISTSGQDQNNEIGIIEVMIEGGKVPFDWWVQNGEWEAKNWLGAPGLFSFGQQTSTLTYKYETGLDEIEVVVLFAESESAGIAHVQIDQKVQSFNLHEKNNGIREVIMTATTPPLSARWKAFVSLSYVSDILLLGFLIFIISAWGLTSPVLKNKCRLFWQQLLRFEKTTNNITTNEEIHSISRANPSTKNKSRTAWTYLSALFFITPAMLAALRMQTEISFSTMLFNGGKECFQTNLCIIVLFFYVFLFIHALGTLFLPVPPSYKKPFLVALDGDLIHFFCGASILSIFGFILGLLNLLIPWVTIPIFCGVLYFYFLQSPDIFNRFWNWLTARNIEGAPLRTFIVIINSIIMFLVLYILLVKGILPDLTSTDVMQLYFSYFAEVRLQHSTWIDPMHPIIYDFMIGRGMGVYLFFTSFTNQYFIQIIGVIYMVSIALLIYQLIFLIIPDDTDKASWVGSRHVLPTCASIMALISLAFITETGKYHLQTGAFLTFLLLYTLRFLFLDTKQSKWLYKVLIPVSIALPIAFLQSEFFICMVLFAAAVTIYMRRGLQFAKYCVFLIIIGSTATLFSLLFNQLYIGIAALNPASFFLRLANFEKLNHWTSIELINYLSWTQGMGFFDLKFAGVYFSEIISNIFKSSPLYIYIGIFFILIGNMHRSGVKFHKPQKLFSTNVLTFCCVFLSFAVIWKLLTIFVASHSVSRMFHFIYVYPPTVCFAAVVFIVLASQQTTIHENEFVKKTRMRSSLLLILGIGSLIFSMILGYPHSIRLQVILIITAAAIILHREWSPRLLIQLQRFSTYTAFIIPVLVTFITLYGIVVSFHSNASSPFLPRAIRYFTGSEGLIEGIPPSELDFHRCLEILEAVPGDDPVLPLNANLNIVPCQNSPQLPRNKIVHHYESVLAPIYKDVLLGDAQMMHPQI